MVSESPLSWRADSTLTVKLSPFKFSEDVDAALSRLVVLASRTAVALVTLGSLLVSFTARGFLGVAVRAATVPFLIGDDPRGRPLGLGVTCRGVEGGGKCVLSFAVNSNLGGCGMAFFLSLLSSSKPASENVISTIGSSSSNALIHATIPYSSASSRATGFN